MLSITGIPRRPCLTDNFASPGYVIFAAFELYSIACCEVPPLSSEALVIKFGSDAWLSDESLLRVE